MRINLGVHIISNTNEHFTRAYEYICIYDYVWIKIDFYMFIYMRMHLHEEHLKY